MVQVDSLESYSAGKMPVVNNGVSSSRREIANSNERKRMIAINEGFSTLRDIVPGCAGDKQSKSKILRLAASYIRSLLAKIALLEAKNGSEVDYSVEVSAEEMKSSKVARTNDSGTDSNISSPGVYIEAGRVPSSDNLQTNETVCISMQGRNPAQDRGTRRPRSHTETKNAREGHFKSRSYSMISSQSQGHVHAPPLHPAARQDAFLPAKDLEQSIQELQDRLEEMKGSLAAHNTPLLTPVPSPMYGPENGGYTQAPRSSRTFDRTSSIDQSQLPPSHSFPSRKEMENPSPRWQPYLPRRPTNKDSPSWSPKRGCGSELSHLASLPPTVLPTGEAKEYHGYKSQLSHSQYQRQPQTYDQNENMDVGEQEVCPVTNERTSYVIPTDPHGNVTIPKPDNQQSETANSEAINQATQNANAPAATRVFSMLSSHPFSTSRDANDWHEKSRSSQYYDSAPQKLSSSKSNYALSWPRNDHASRPCSDSMTGTEMYPSEVNEYGWSRSAQSMENLNKSHSQAYSQSYMAGPSPKQLRDKKNDNTGRAHSTSEVLCNEEHEIHRAPGGSLDTLCEAIYKIDGAIADPAGTCQVMQ
ncbi:hypothetical protein SARC_04775 [Sphaeroforma arctica JP610]|uniref:BHLH domain-containing protein n=1 Tax=Sphaeroforma arctica JP610 TaxID=667725 RepID=A0A0L0G3Z4_9EUKA|nr:hypothetical protein SARC_04775 [Sphaeroforma arctica JP610]KNC82953.1 hypothetical protein SARC_04775 [Sphaeroforma arctica JP610]|eukprot:XP_014156855.1 hypothetical protein SARC_04775 [Sphaeroforma arctica JP610]